MFIFKNYCREYSVTNPTTTFSRGVVSGWSNANAYSFHQYNVNTGQSMANGYDNVKNNLTSYGAGSLPVYVTETNCYSGSLSEEYVGQDIIDTGDTAACAANRLSFLLDRPDYLYLFKLTQGYSTLNSTVSKNGV